MIKISNYSAYLNVSVNDIDAIHVNVNNEINDIDEKFPVSPTDSLVIEDSLDSFSKKKARIAGITIDAIGDGTTFKKMLFTERTSIADSIHKSEVGEINSITQKANPISADMILIEDSEDAWNKKKASFPVGGGGTDPNALHVNASDEINSIQIKAIPIEADILVIEDSEELWAKKKIPLSAVSVDTSAIHSNVSNEINVISQKIAPVGTDKILIEDSEDTWTKKSILLSSFLSSDYKSYMMPCEYSADLGARRVRSVGSTQRFNFHIPYDFKEFGIDGGLFVCGFPTLGASIPGRIVEVTIDHDSGPQTAYNDVSTFNTVTYDLTGYADSLWMLPIASYMTPLAGITGGIYLNHTLLGGTIRYIGTMVIYK